MPASAAPAAKTPAESVHAPPPIPSFDAQTFFAEPLIDLGTADSAAWAGIYTPQAEIGQTKVGLTRQFLEDAATYHQKYSNTAMFKALISRALVHCGKVEAQPTILDIGSGSGNSVFPCLELMPSCRIVATDLSPNLLRILLDHVNGQAGARGRVVPVCMDATRDYYRAGSFDYVIGAAILHHLLDPVAAIQAAARALKPGGHAIFFEPFEAGNALLRLAYREILMQSERDRDLEQVLAKLPPSLYSLLRSLRPFLSKLLGPEQHLPPDVATLLAAMVEDYRVRAGLDKSAPIYRQIDDKWLFTRGYIEEHARQAGFTRVHIEAIYQGDRPCVQQTQVNLALGIGQRPEHMPGWAWQVLERYDEALSPELKRELLVEGIIVLQRG